MSEIRERLLNRFRRRDYRHSYVESFLNSLVSAQIRILREREGWSQKDLAERIGTTQSAISRIESPDYSSWRIETLRKLARAFDSALSVKFVSFGDSLDDIAGFGSDRLIRPSFSDDPVFHGSAVLNFPGPKVGSKVGASWTSVGESLEAGYG
jgi:transcriptional regulator with XRE-family HTH domain